MGNPDGGAKGGGVHFGLQEGLAGGILGGVRVFPLWSGSLRRVWVVLSGLIWVVAACAVWGWVLFCGSYWGGLLCWDFWLLSARCAIRSGRYFATFGYGVIIA